MIRKKTRSKTRKENNFLNLHFPAVSNGKMETPKAITLVNFFVTISKLLKKE